MKKVLLLLGTLFLLLGNIFAQNITVKPGWNFYGAQENEICTSQFNNPNIVGVMKYIGNGTDFSLTPQNWAVWTKDENLMNQLESLGYQKLYKIYEGESFVVYSTGNANLNISGYCPGNILPIGTVSSDYKNGNYAVVNLNDWSVEKNLNPTPLGGDIRTYLFDDYIFVVDAPAAKNQSTWYVYKTDSLSAPIANYNINGANPQGFAIKNLHKAYLTNFQGNEIIIFNPLTGEKEGSIDLTPYLYKGNNYIAAFNMLLYKDKLFVTAKRRYVGWSSSDPNIPDHSYILVIDTNSDKVIKAIPVNYDPLDPQIYNGYLYFLSKGDYSSPIGKIYRINISNLELDNSFIITSPKNPDNESQTDYIKNFVITNEGEMFIVANNGVWGAPYHVFRILNVTTYNDSTKTGLIPTPIYTGSYIRDIAYTCNYVIVADRNKDDTKSYLVFINKDGKIVKKIQAQDLGYEPFMIGTNYFYF